MASFWEVVGGADKGGILVRDGQSLKSSELPGRLRLAWKYLPLMYAWGHVTLHVRSTGAVLGELERAGERLRYCLLQGTGPAEGWISLKAGQNLRRSRPSHALKAAENDACVPQPQFACCILLFVARWLERT